PRGYLARLVRNEMYNVPRRRRLSFLSLYDREGVLRIDPPSRLPSPEQMALAREEWERRQQALQKLPARARLVAEGRLAGRSNSEIAAEMDCTAGAVACSWNRVRKVLAEAVEDNLEAPSACGNP